MGGMLDVPGIRFQIVKMGGIDMPNLYNTEREIVEGGRKAKVTKAKKALRPKRVKRVRR